MKRLGKKKRVVVDQDTSLFVKEKDQGFFEASIFLRKFPQESVPN